MMLTLLDTFSGIGGFSLAARWTNAIETVAFCEIEPFCQAVLRKHWPEVYCFDDIRTLTADSLRERGIDRVDILTGGVPCQPASLAGKRKGENDERWLWDEFLRLVSDVRPLWVLAENPPGICSLPGKNLDWICDELESQGYEVQPFLVSAANVGAPHLRERVWIVARNTCDTERSGFSGNDWRRTGKKSEIRLLPYEQGAFTDTLVRIGELQAGNLAGRRSASSETSAGIGDIADPVGQSLTGDDGQEQQATLQRGWNQAWPEVAASLCRMDARLSSWVDGRGKRRNSRNERLKALGNSIVPHCVYLFLQGIVDMETIQK